MIHLFHLENFSDSSKEGHLQYGHIRMSITAQIGNATIISFDQSALEKYLLNKPHLLPLSNFINQKISKMLSKSFLLKGLSNVQVRFIYFNNCLYIIACFILDGLLWTVTTNKSYKRRRNS
jgi:hypothetical protein